jgi:hypothetical protein
VWGAGERERKREKKDELVGGRERKEERGEGHASSGRERGERERVQESRAATASAFSPAQIN